MIFGDQHTYYRYHSKIYDGTRWAFLFGRKRLTHLLPRIYGPLRILEVGCGTGYQLKRFAERYPQAEIVGIDPSPHMIAEARKNNKATVKLIKGSYPEHQFSNHAFDMIICSYSLTMLPDPVEAVKKMTEELRPGGILLCADFFDTPSPVFERWMLSNHVRFIPQLFEDSIPNEGFRMVRKEVRKAYGGLWTYGVFGFRK